jgi:hypothetical protein
MQFMERLSASGSRGESEMGNTRIQTRRFLILSVAILGTVMGAAISVGHLSAAESFSVFEARQKAEAAHLAAVRKTYDTATATADVVAEVRVLSVVCKEARHDKEGKLLSITLQIAMQVLAVERGGVETNDILVVTRDVETPQMVTITHYNTGTRTVDLLEGNKGNVALTWDEKRRGYLPLAGWLTERSLEEIPVEVGDARYGKVPPPPQP